VKKHHSFALLAVLLTAVAATAGPIIEVDNADYDFGKHPSASAVTHDFIISNVGDAPLSILDIRTSCGCTTTALSKSELAPGESVELEVTVDLTNFSGRTNQLIYVSSNDLTSRKLTLRITGEVFPAQPYHITAKDLGDLLVLLIDLRDPEAYVASHIVGAINIPFPELESWIDRLPAQVHTIVLYDQTGSLSDQAVHRLSAAGFNQARSLLGGLDEWKRQFGDRYLFPAVCQ
jgi:rhodanese-related sulfurtransferase